MTRKLHVKGTIITLAVLDPTGKLIDIFPQTNQILKGCPAVKALADPALIDWVFHSARKHAGFNCGVATSATDAYPTSYFITSFPCQSTVQHFYAYYGAGS